MSGIQQPDAQNIRNADAKNVRDGAAQELQTPGLTHVELIYDQGKIERWIRFGRPVEDRIIDGWRRRVSFAPGSIFAFVRWQANDFGTVLSRIDILRALEPHEAMTSVGFMRPGGEILLRMSTWPKVQLVLNQIDAIERAGFDPPAICPDHWRHIHNRLSANQMPRDYTRERDATWLLRKALTS